jgi:hypothetical protein
LQSRAEEVNGRRVATVLITRLPAESGNGQVEGVPGE